MRFANESPLITLTCVVLESDFEEMISCYDSGMVDVTAKNLAAIALRRHLGPGHHVRVCQKRGTDHYRCLINARKFPVSQNVGRLIRQAERGVFPRDFEFRVSVPREYLRLPPGQGKPNPAHPQQPEA